MTVAAAALGSGVSGIKVACTTGGSLGFCAGCLLMNAASFDMITDGKDGRIIEDFAERLEDSSPRSL
jgi:hypothetical protein